MQFSMILAVLLIPLLVAAEKYGEERHRKYTVQSTKPQSYIVVIVLHEYLVLLSHNLET